MLIRQGSGRARPALRLGALEGMLYWHGRQHRQRWLRETIREACRTLDDAVQDVAESLPSASAGMITGGLPARPALAAAIARGSCG